MLQNISFITLAVNDFNKELVFYRDILGWKPFNVVEGSIAFFNTGGLVFSICAYTELSKDVGLALTTRPHLGVTLAQNLPSEQAVDKVFDHIRASGSTLTKEPSKTSWGGYSGYFTDPEGYLWEIAYNPQFEYDNNGIMVIPNA